MKRQFFPFALLVLPLLFTACNAQEVDSTDTDTLFEQMKEDPLVTHYAELNSTVQDMVVWGDFDFSIIKHITAKRDYDVCNMELDAAHESVRPFFDIHCELRNTRHEIHEKYPGARDLSPEQTRALYYKFEPITKQEADDIWYHRQKNGK